MFFQYLEKIKLKMRSYHAAVVVSLFSGFFVVYKIFLIKGCWAFDMNDDANHTFPNLFVARIAFKLGQLPQMNFFNNFGSPLLGDALTYPFAIHSITYWFLESPIAMTVNRLLFACFTVYLGYMFFKRYLKEFSSILCSFWVFFSAVNLWFFATYHMQLALFFEFSLLLLNQRTPGSSIRAAFTIFAVCVIMILSLSVNLSVFILALVFASNFIDDKFHLSRRTALLLIAIVSAIITTWFQFGAFIQGMINSSRLHNHYSELATFDFLLLVKHILFFSLLRWHPDATVFLSIPVVICAILGIFIMRNQKNFFFQKAFLLGIILPLFCYALMIVPSIWWSIPLLNATDLTRVVWLTLPFMFLSVGATIDYLLDRRFIHTQSTVRILIYALICVIFAIGERKGVERILRLDNWPCCAHTHHFALYEEYKMHPSAIALDMIPLNRFTSEGPSWEGDDLRGVYNQLLGSNERAIISDQTLTKNLRDLNLIEIEDDPNKTYHFTAPWNAQLMNRLGVRYIILKEKLEQNESGWNLIKIENSKYLYESKFLSSPVYFINNGKITPLRTFKIAGNQVIINLPKINAPEELVATFLNLPDYHATLDGKPTKLFSPTQGFPFIHVWVNPGDHILILKFQRYTWKDLIIFAFSGLLFFSVGSLLISRLKSKPNSRP
ncbi:MAG: hypothetical protein K0S27_14 [Gammaproteobacteria bacterium]|jgi:hypothetical protein|nr:hypothetical protein [Gammaproteobacteria bacterium]